MAFITACSMVASAVIGAFVGYYVGGTPDAAGFGALLGFCCGVPAIFMAGVVVALTVSGIQDRRKNK